MADPALAIVRAIHFASVLLLFGQFTYLFAVDPDRRAPPGFSRVAACCLSFASITLVAWLLFEAASMSGLELPQALRGDTISIVLTQTLFGRVTLLRLILSGVLFVVLFAWPGSGQGLARLSVAAILAALLLASLAATGHAAAESGIARVGHLAIDGTHLLSAGAWLGALIPLIVALRETRHGSPGAKRAAARATWRFSILGIVCMALLLGTGVLNATYTVQPVSMALESEYGRLLAFKIGLFALIVAVAAVNRTVLMPDIKAGATGEYSERAADLLRRNALIELALGLAIVAIVGVLGITVPASHANALAHAQHFL